MPQIKPGDVLAFLGNWWNPGHALIMLAQMSNGGDDDSLWRVVHVGFVMMLKGELCVIEFTLFRIFPWPKGGMKITPLEVRRKEYKYGILHLPLDLKARDLLNEDNLELWFKRHRQDGYNILGLVFAILRWFRGWRFRGCYFCSEAVRAALSYAEAWNDDEQSIGYRNGRPRTVHSRVEPQRVSPWDTVRARCFHRWRLLPY